MKFDTGDSKSDHDDDNADEKGHRINVEYYKIKKENGLKAKKIKPSPDWVRYPRWSSYSGRRKKTIQVLFKKLRKI